MQKETDYKANTMVMSLDGYTNLVGSDDGKNIYWTDDVNVELPIRMPSTGVGARLQPSTIPAHVKRIAAERQNLPALKV